MVREISLNNNTANGYSCHAVNQFMGYYRFGEHADFIKSVLLEFSYFLAADVNCSATDDPNELPF